MDTFWRPLSDACVSSDPEACDLLYLYDGSGARSGISMTCGNRLPRADPPACVDKLGSVDLDLWRSDCERGDNGACDLLFFYSPIGSEDEAFALACGGRGDDSFLPCGVRLGLGRY